MPDEQAPREQWGSTWWVRLQDHEAMRTAYAREGAEQREEIERLRQEVAVDDQLLADRNRLLDLFECPVHGPRCIPHAVSEVHRLRTEVIELRARLARVNRT